LSSTVVKTIPIETGITCVLPAESLGIMPKPGVNIVPSWNIKPFVITARFIVINRRCVKKSVR